MKGVMMAGMAAGMAAQVASIAGDAYEATNGQNDAAMSAALGLNAGMMAAQLANDMVAMAVGAMMGKDLCVPPGTVGAVVFSPSFNVLIGGFPMPSWLNIAKGIMKLVKGLRRRGGGNGGRAGSG
jgi:hypothetical protein